MKKTLTAIVAVALTALGSAGPVAAYDQDGFAYAASHMVLSVDIPANLSVKRNAKFTAENTSHQRSLCFVEDTCVGYQAGEAEYAIVYRGRASGKLEETVVKYSTAKAAGRAFRTLLGGIDETNEGNGRSNPDDYANIDSRPLATTSENKNYIYVGDQQAYTDIAPSSSAVIVPFTVFRTRETHTVITLLDQVVNSTNYQTGLDAEVSMKQRRSVHMVAFAATERWLG